MLMNRKQSAGNNAQAGARTRRPKAGKTAIQDARFADRKQGKETQANNKERDWEKSRRETNETTVGSQTSGQTGWRRCKIRWKRTWRCRFRGMGGVGGGGGRINGLATGTGGVWSVVWSACPASIIIKMIQSAQMHGGLGGLGRLSRLGRPTSGLVWLAYSEWTSSQTR